MQAVPAPLDLTSALRIYYRNKAEIDRIASGLGKSLQDDIYECLRSNLRPDAPNDVEMGDLGDDEYSSGDYSELVAKFKALNPDDARKGAINNQMTELYNEYISMLHVEGPDEAAGMPVDGEAEAVGPAEEVIDMQVVPGEESTDVAEAQAVIAMPVDDKQLNNNSVNMNPKSPPKASGINWVSLLPPRPPGLPPVENDAASMVPPPPIENHVYRRDTGHVKKAVKAQKYDKLNEMKLELREVIKRDKMKKMQEMQALEQAVGDRARAIVFQATQDIAELPKREFESQSLVKNIKERNIHATQANDDIQARWETKRKMTRGNQPQSGEGSEGGGTKGKKRRYTRKKK